MVFPSDIRRVLHCCMLSVVSDSLGQTAVCGRVPDLQRNCGDGTVFGCLADGVRKTA